MFIEHFTQYRLSKEKIIFFADFDKLVFLELREDAAKLILD